MAVCPVVRATWSSNSNSLPLWKAGAELKIPNAARTGELTVDAHGVCNES
jgi:hypothetical protein